MVTNNNQNAAESSKADSSDPYFTHHSDHPGMILVSKKLNGDNYHGWKRAMTLALNSKNKLGFVNGSCKPPSKVTHPDSYEPWSRCNDMVHSWIINTLDPEIADSVIYYATAHEVWEDLHERFSQGNAPHVYDILQKITTQNQEELSVSAYYTKLKGLWDELSIYADSNEGAPSEQQKLMKFLMGLNDTYAAVRNQILMQTPLPTVRQSYASITQVEKQINMSSTKNEVVAAAMLVKSSPNQQHQSGNSANNSANNGESLSFGNSWNNDRDGSWISDNTNGGQWRGQCSHARGGRSTGLGRGRPHCSHCKKAGHWKDTCWVLHGYPPTHPKVRLNQSKFANNISATPGDEEETVTISKAHLDQLLSSFSNQGGKSVSTSNSKINTVTKTGSDYEEDDWFG